MSTHWQRLATARPTATEAASLILLFGFTVSGVALSAAVAPEPQALWPGLLPSAAACAALYWRRDHPVLAFGLTLLCAMGLGALGYLLTPLLMAPLLIGQFWASARARIATWNSALTAAACLVITGLFLSSFPDSLVFVTVSPAAWVLLAAVCGNYVRVRREYALARTEHADREREEEARHRVTQERVRIARELHDVVAHHLALANAQAGTAAHLARTHPEQAFEVLDRLSDTTAAALTEMKATVGLLRQASDDADDLAPAPGLRQLTELIDGFTTADLDVSVTVDGDTRPLPTGPDLAAYRIIQEALTNVTKHAATRTATVRLAYTRRHLTVSVTNEAVPGGSVPTAGPQGFGLVGMRERAMAAGGTFRAGPRPEGGFEVTCTLPLNSTAESTSR
ncbi:sensor histidine kinase [Streptomyces sp. NPDC057363]|uniref:sensor histidine kinase n=1 Tax=Streptomyces sp. NPDC057363 TaxID=3346107 RepID=UPI00363DA6C7